MKFGTVCGIAAGLLVASVVTVMRGVRFGDAFLFYLYWGLLPHFIIYAIPVLGPVVLGGAAGAWMGRRRRLLDAQPWASFLTAVVLWPAVWYLPVITGSTILRVRATNLVPLPGQSQILRRRVQWGNFEGYGPRVDIEFRSIASTDSLASFYERTLPQAGWSFEGRTPVRHVGVPGDDLLWITFKRDSARVRVRIPEPGTADPRVITATYFTRWP